MVRTRSIGKSSPNTSQESSFRPSTKGRKRQITQTEDASVLTSSAALSPLPGPSTSQPTYPRFHPLNQDECHLSPGRRPSVGDRDTEQQQQQQLVLGGEHANLSHVSHPLPSGSSLATSAPSATQPSGGAGLLSASSAAAGFPAAVSCVPFVVSNSGGTGGGYLQQLTTSSSSGQQTLAQISQPLTTATTASASWLVPIESTSVNSQQEADILQPVGGQQQAGHAEVILQPGPERSLQPGVSGSNSLHQTVNQIRQGSVAVSAAGGQIVLPHPVTSTQPLQAHTSHTGGSGQQAVTAVQQPLEGAGQEREVSPPLHHITTSTAHSQQQQQHQQQGGGGEEGNASDLVIFTTRESGVQADVENPSSQAASPNQTSQGYLPDDIKHSLECPVCARIALPPVMQCRNGHVTCNPCRMKVQSCPMCREIDIDIRNLFAEKAITYLNIPCEYKSFGCRVEIHFKDKENHERGCRFRPYICPYIECEHKLAADAVVLHVSTAHREECRRSDGAEITASMILIGMYFGGDGAWSPRVITCFGRTFFDVALTRDRWLHHWVWLLGEEEEAAQFLYEITAFKGNTKYVYGSEVSSLRTSDDEIVSEGKCLSISDAIGRRLRDGDKIRYRLKLMRK